MIFNIRKKSVILIILVCFLFLLDFIPIKYAIDEPIVANDRNSYVFNYKLKTGLPGFQWITYVKVDDAGRVGILIAKLIGDSPYDILSEKEFNLEELWRYTSGLKFRFYGRIEELDDANEYDINVHSESWDIIKPIYRTSIRKYYAPKDYLTIYDYNWIKVIKQLLN